MVRGVLGGGGATAYGVAESWTRLKQLTLESERIQLCPHF